MNYEFEMEKTFIDTTADMREIAATFIVTTADMREIAASPPGGNGSKYVDIVGLMENAAKELREKDAEIDRLREENEYLKALAIHDQYKAESEGEERGSRWSDRRDAG
jgi:hypothetical protein